MNNPAAAPKMNFDNFYREVFLPEHRHPLNVALHMAGTIAGLVFIVAVLPAPWAWWPALLLFPVVHAARGSSATGGSSATPPSAMRAGAAAITPAGGSSSATTA